MIFKEEVKDLFTVPQGYMLAHCISADFNLGGGIARQFCKHYDMGKRLIYGFGEDFSDVGTSLQIDNVHNLITKRYVKDKPTYSNLRNALENMKFEMELDGQKKVAMPRIGCGLDGLDWKIVKAIIKDVFEDTDIEVLICTREEDLPVDKDTEDDVDDKISEYECDCAECNDCQVDSNKELKDIYNTLLDRLKEKYNKQEN